MMNAAVAQNFASPQLLPAPPFGKCLVDLTVATFLILLAVPAKITRLFLARGS
jgi:hypothetical protein